LDHRIGDHEDEPDAFSRDYGDAPAEDQSRVFDGPVRELDVLLLRTRGRLFVDWSFNREIQVILREVTP